MKQNTIFWNRKGVRMEDQYTRLDGGVGLIHGPIRMQCFPLYSILKSIEKTHVNYLSLDVEGTEYEVLNTAFLKNNDFQFDIGTIEASHIGNPQFGSSYLELVYLMNQKGYARVEQIGEDTIFIHKNFNRNK